MLKTKKQSTQRLDKANAKPIKQRVIRITLRLREDAVAGVDAKAAELGLTRNAYVQQHFLLNLSATLSQSSQMAMAS